MSHKWISEQFASGEITSEGRFNFGALGPEDCVLHAVYHRIRSDATMQALFENQFDLCWARPQTLQDIPMLYVYPAEQRDEEPRPTETNVLEVAIGVAVVHDADPGSLTSVLGYNDTAGAAHVLEPGMATLMHAIKQLLRRGRQLTVTKIDGIQVDLARKSFPGRSSGFPVPDTEAGRDVWAHEIEWIYEVHLNNETGVIRNIE